MKFSKNIMFKRDPSFSRCPSCSEAYELRRSHSRNIKEKIFIKLSFFKIYRCKNCGWRGFLSTVTITKNSLIVFFSYLLLALISAFVVLQILKRTFK